MQDTGRTENIVIIDQEEIPNTVSTARVNKVVQSHNDDGDMRQQFGKENDKSDEEKCIRELFRWKNKRIKFWKSERPTTVQVM